MKSKNLIKLLQYIDPSGEIEVVGNDNADIHFFELKQSYWDGKAQIHIRDKDDKIIGIKYQVEGNKIQIRTYSVEDAIFDNPDILVDVSEIRSHMSASLESIEMMIEDLRKESRKLFEEYK